MLYAVIAVCFVIVQASTLDNSMKLSISCVPDVDFLTNVSSIFNLLAPGAFSFEEPEALSNYEVSSVDDKELSVTCNPILYVGVFEYLSKRTVCSSQRTKNPLV